MTRQASSPILAVGPGKCPGEGRGHPRQSRWEKGSPLSCASEGVSLAAQWRCRQGLKASRGETGEPGLPTSLQGVLRFLTPRSASPLLHVVGVRLTQLVPEEQAEDGVRPDTEVAGPQALVDPPESFCAHNFGKAIQESCIKQTLQQRGGGKQKRNRPNHFNKQPFPRRT